VVVDLLPHLVQLCLDSHSRAWQMTVTRVSADLAVVYNGSLCNSIKSSGVVYIYQVVNE